MKPVTSLLLSLGALGAGLALTFRRSGGAMRGSLRGEIEANELLLYCENDGEIHRRNVQPIEANLKKKVAKGTYNHELSKKAWMYVAETCAKKYAKEFGGVWHQMFSTADRRHVAAAFADSFREEYVRPALHGRGR